MVNLTGKAVKELKLPTVQYHSAPIQVVTAQVGDTNSRFLSVKLYDDNGIINLSKYTSASLNITLPNEELDLSTGEIDADNNIIYVEIVASMLQEPGIAACDISLESDDAWLTSQRFYIYIAPSQVNKESLETNGDYNKLRALYKEIKEIEDDRKNKFDEVIEDLLSLQNVSTIDITYGNLKILRDESKLVPGQTYRLTDYECTTTQDNTQSAGHQFDLILIADDVNVLNENCKAVKHEGDTYFKDSNLDAWEVKYSLDNDKVRFGWADEENGKGVIYYLKDEWNNECYYDFKNIQFARYKRKYYTGEEARLTALNSEWTATVGYKIDGAFPDSAIETPVGKSLEDMVKEYISSHEGIQNIFASKLLDWQFSVSNDTRDFRTFRANYRNQSGEVRSKEISLKAEATDQTKWFYTFSSRDGSDITDDVVLYDASVRNNDLNEQYTPHDNVIGEYYIGAAEDQCSLNNIIFFASTGNSCYGNNFGTSCCNMIFGGDCHSNSFGSNCCGNLFGDCCYSNSFGSACSDNLFDNDCGNNSFGNNCWGISLSSLSCSNSFASECNSTSLGAECYSNSLGCNCYENVLGDYCICNTLLDGINGVELPAETNYNVVPINNKIAELAESIDAAKDIAFTNAVVTNYQSDTKYEKYPYKADISLDGVTKDMLATVTFNILDTNKFAPECETYDGGVYIWSNINQKVTIPLIKVEPVKIIPVPTEGLEYRKIEGKEEYAVTGIGTATDLDIVIPSTHQGLPVTTIEGFHGYDDVDFGTDYFSIRTVIIPNSVTFISADAFSYSTLENITIPNSVTSIGDYAFYGCSSLTSITIPDSVMSIGWLVFSNCYRLESINVDSNNTAYSSQDGILYNKDKTELIRVPNTKTSVTIPDSVKFISSYAFSGCSLLENITIPNSVTSVGDNAFDSCESLKYNEYNNGLYLGNTTNPYLVLVRAKDRSITNCVVGNTTKVIYEEAFRYCSSLTSVTIPDSVTFIGSQAFYNCNKLTSITIPNGVTSIDYEAFHNCSSLESITIPHGVTSIGDRAFGGCSSLASITIPDSVTSIGDYAFYGCSSLTSIIFNGTVAQWNKILTQYGWNNNVPATQVQCSDGTVALT